MYWFANDGDPELFCSSADWLERNLLRRIETCFPILDPDLAERVRDEALVNYLADNCNAWALDADGRYERVLPAGDEMPHSAQNWLLAKICMRVNEIPARPRATALPLQDGDLLAAVDLGSNSFHMVVARYVLGQLRVGRPPARHGAAGRRPRRQGRPRSRRAPARAGCLSRNSASACATSRRSACA